MGDVEDLLGIEEEDALGGHEDQQSYNASTGFDTSLFEENDVDQETM